MTLSASNNAPAQTDRPLVDEAMAALVDLPQQAGVANGDIVRTTGPKGMTAVYWLNRLGYRNTAFVHPKRVATMQPVDALVVPHACGTKELAGLIQHGGCVREGGILIVQTPPDWVAERGEASDAMLVRLGYHVERVAEGAHQFLVARRQGFGALTRAA